MRIAIAKPDWGVRGGFEVVMAHTAHALEREGHEVSWRTVDVAAIDRAPFGVDIPEPVWDLAWEAFRYLGLVEAFRRLDARGADLVLSTQPPSFAVDHPRHLAIFFHHLRIYYDLSDVYLAAGFADPRAHALATDAVRRVDQRYLHDVVQFRAGSPEVARRLEQYNGAGDRTALCLFTSDLARELAAAPASAEHGPVLCVSRHEFPKRTELFVHAMKYLRAVPGVCVGSGGRLPFARALDARLASGAIDLDALGPTDLWCNRGEVVGPPPEGARSNVTFLDHVTRHELATRYRAASCVVAPAYLEDYGLTVIEAMSAGKPVVVCHDGGGLVDFVDDGVEGFVVDPDGRSIAAAVQRLVDDPSLARTMGAAGRERAQAYTWERAMAQLREGIAQVMDAPPRGAA